MPCARRCLSPDGQSGDREELEGEDLLALSGWMPTATPASKRRRGRVTQGDAF